MQFKLRCFNFVNEIEKQKQLLLINSMYIIMYYLHIIFYYYVLSFNLANKRTNAYVYNICIEEYFYCFIK